nr:oxidoreductase family protein [uncultured Carboxylicivirga sp.]
MDIALEKRIAQNIGAERIIRQEVIQNLWSGYGEIVRYKVEGGVKESIIVKHVKLPDSTKHPRGWNTDFSHQRKVKSYEVETHWYKNYSDGCSIDCKVPECYYNEELDNEVLIVLEDLDISGFPMRKYSVSINEMEACLSWLANFHATFLNRKPEGLWEVGTYWHLSTRPDELDVMDDPLLKEAAPLVDQKLSDCRYKTFVHGDAKLANFCFSDKNEVAAVDFQYVGGGCGMKDVAYFIGSCIYEEECKKYEQPLLDYYFEQLQKALIDLGIEEDGEELEKEWRDLYPYAWTDFHRFLKGWSPDHWKLNSYSEKMARKVIKELGVTL